MLLQDFWHLAEAYDTWKVICKGPNDIIFTEISLFS